MKVFLITGKARNGKNTVANFIQEYYEAKGKKALQTFYGKYVRMYTQEISGWGGDNENKPRDLLNQIGTDIIRKKLNKFDMFVNRMKDDLDVYNEFFDVVIINDIRFPIEIDAIKEYHKDSFSMCVKRLNFDNGLTEGQKTHAIETSMDDYDKYDYVIINDTLEQLKIDVDNILEGLDNNESNK